MPIRFPCVACTARIKVPDGTEGKLVKCPGCGHAQRVPSQPVEVSTALPEVPVAQPVRARRTTSPPPAVERQAGEPAKSAAKPSVEEHADMVASDHAEASLAAGGSHVVEEDTPEDVRQKELGPKEVGPKEVGRDSVHSIAAPGSPGDEDVEKEDVEREKVDESLDVAGHASSRSMGPRDDVTETGDANDGGDDAFLASEHAAYATADAVVSDATADFHDSDQSPVEQTIHTEPQFASPPKPELAPESKPVSHREPEPATEQNPEPEQEQQEWPQESAVADEFYAEADEPVAVPPVVAVARPRAVHQAASPNMTTLLLAGWILRVIAVLSVAGAVKVLLLMSDSNFSVIDMLFVMPMVLGLVVTFWAVGELSLAARNRLRNERR